MSPLISLVMTTYNRERYLGAAIESVLQQTLTDFELLVWDDGSDDRSVAIADRYAQRDQRVRVIAAAHRGRVAALQAAIAHTTGTYLGWVDSDDLLAPTALEQTTRLLNAQPQVGMVYTDYVDIDEQGTVMRYGQRCRIPYSKERLLLDFMTFHFRLLRRSVFEQVGGINGASDYVEDYDLCLRLSEVTEIQRVRQPLYYYRNHADSASQRWQLEQVLRSRAAIAQALKRRGLADELAIEVRLPDGRFFLRRKAVPTPAKAPLIARMGSLLASLPLLGVMATAPARAQSVTSATDGTNTSVTLNGDRYDISGGTQAGTNLFQSFQRFGLSASETANFLANPQIQNLLGRVIGGEASIINGRIQITGGTPNLFLLNPTGIIFGANASLNVPASFTATTANGIGFSGGWFSATGTNDYAALVGTPSTFAFTASQPGSIVNAGNLTVGNGQALALLGGSVVNTGQLAAPGGQIVITAVPGQNLVRLSQPGNLLSLEFQPLSPTIAAPNPSPFAPPSLAQLLTGSSSGNATGLTTNPDGTVQLTGSGIQIPTTPGTAIASGSLNVAGQAGGNVRVLGSQVALVSATVNASGVSDGGTVQIGGNEQGKGVLPNAAQTFISEDSTLNVDAGAIGSGGRAIVWADQNTAFGGTISARGGSIIGNGGFVEVSGKQNLLFRGTVDTSATNGTSGTLLLDPTDISILPGGPAIGFSGQVLFADVGPTTIFQNQLQALPGNTTILIQATNSISFATLGTLTFATGNGAITFQAGGPITMTPTDTIRAGGRSVTFTGGSLSLGNIDTSLTGFPGTGGFITLTSNIASTTARTLNSSANATFNSAQGGNVTVTSARDMTIDAINAQGLIGAGYGGYNGTGGNVTLTTNGSGVIRLLNTFPDAAGRDASVSSIGRGYGGGTSTNGSIAITHGGGLTNTDFIVGDATVNGSAGVIDADGTSVLPIASRFAVAPTGGIAGETPTGITVASVNTPPTLVANTILSGATQNVPFPIGAAALALGVADSDGDVTTVQIVAIAPGATLTLNGNPVTPGSVTLTSGDVLVYTPPTDATGLLNAFTLRASDGVSTSNQVPIQVNVQGATDLPDLCALTSCSKTDLKPVGNPLPEFKLAPDTPDDRFTRTFESYLGLGETRPRSREEPRDIAQRIEQDTGAKPAFIYISFVPASLKAADVSQPKQLQVDDTTDTSFAQTSQRSTDQLELIVVTARGDAIRKRIPEATRANVLPLAQRFRNEISDPRKTRATTYLGMSRQLYQWMIAPIAADLQTRGIDNLVFLLDTGLRSLPIAALNDGQGFLVEKYSIGVMPSLSLTDTRYRNIRDVKVLGLGISESTQDQPPLPAVPVEVSILVNQLWSGKLAFNNNVTLANLKAFRQEQPFGIIHMATHADFYPGAIDNSYIQLWNDKLRLDQVRQLGWSDPQIELLVLSACATALGDRDAELGFGGLAVQTGVKTAVASLWYVSDAATTALMTGFYKDLRTARIKADALQKAQVAMATGKVFLQNGRLQGIEAGEGIALPPASLAVRDRQLSHPYYWAAFTMIGNPW